MSIEVDIIECPIGFQQISECHCEQLLDISNVQCNVSATPFKFRRSGNGWIRRQRRVSVNVTEIKIFNERSIKVP